MKIVLVMTIACVACGQQRPADNFAQQEMTSLAKRVDALEHKAERYESTLLDVTTKSYKRVDSNTGVFLISLENVQPYLNGQRLTLRVGNPQNVTYHGFKMTLKWGKPDPLLKPFIYTTNHQTKVEESSLDLAVGSWTALDVVLTPAASDELGYLELSMETNSLSLAR